MNNLLHDNLQEIIKRNILLIKFGTEDNLKKLQKGNVYMKNINYYNTLELKNSGKPDKKDGNFVLKDVNFEIINPKNNLSIAKGYAKNLIMPVGYNKNPIYCLFALDSRNIVDDYKIDENNKGISFLVEFNQTQKSLIKDNLGDYALVILDTQRFLDEIHKKLVENNLDYKEGFINYFNFNSKAYVSDLIIHPDRIPFYKEKSEFEYQNEFRIWIQNYDIADFYSFDIGDISNYSVLLKTEELLNMIFTFNCKYEEVD